MVLKNILRIMTCGPEVARHFGRRMRRKRKAGAATGLCLPCCAVLVRLDWLGEEKPRLAGDCLEKPLLHRLLFLKSQDHCSLFLALWPKLARNQNKDVESIVILQLLDHVLSLSSQSSKALRWELAPGSSCAPSAFPASDIKSQEKLPCFSV